MKGMNTPLGRALTARGLSMREAAKHGIPYVTIAQHVRGARRMSMTSAYRYADILGIPVVELIETPPTTPTTPPEDAEAVSQPAPQEAQDA